MTTIVTSDNGGGRRCHPHWWHQRRRVRVFDGGGYDNKTYLDVCTWPM